MQDVKNKATELLTDVVDKVAFANHIPLLTKATSDNNEPTPGYMFNEIEAICKLPQPQCQQLIDFLLTKLSKSSYIVKIKVLKIILHLIEHADPKFRIGLRRFDSSLKKAAMFYNNPDPLTGSAISKEIQNLANRALESLFDAELMERDEKKYFKYDQNTSHKLLGGLGSVSTTSNPDFPGFGNSSMKNESLKVRMTDFIEKIMDNNTKPQTLLIRNAMCSSSGDYEPVEIKIEDSSNKIITKSKEFKNSSKEHIPGRAGGGWESDDEDRPTPPLSFQFDKLDLGSNIERDTIIEFCSRKEFPVSLNEIKNVCKKCFSLSTVQILQELNSILEKSEESWIFKFRALLILEWFLRSDVHPLFKIILNIISDGLNVCKEDPDFRISKKAEKINLILIGMIQEMKVVEDKSNGSNTIS